MSRCDIRGLTEEEIVKLDTSYQKGKRLGRRGIFTQNYSVCIFFSRKQITLKREYQNLVSLMRNVQNNAEKVRGSTGNSKGAE